MSDLFGVSNGAIALLALTAIISGAAKGFSGFGAALIFVPPASAILDPRVATPIFLMMDCITVVPIVRAGWRLSDKREVGTAAFGAAVGTPLGAIILVHADPDAVRWATSAVSFSVLFILLSG